MTAAAPHLTVVPEQDTAPRLSFIVTPVIEGDDIVQHTVRVELSDVQWRQLVGDIAARILMLRANGRPVLGKLLAAGSRPAGIVQQNALTDLVEMLTGPTHRGSAHTLPPMWDLSVEDATALGCELWDAADDPKVCACGRTVHLETCRRRGCSVLVPESDGTDPRALICSQGCEDDHSATAAANLQHALLVDGRYDVGRKGNGS